MIDDLKVAISEKDIQKARRIMINELIGSNYPHEVFKDAIELANEYEIFEEHNKEKLITKSKEWTEDYLEALIEDLYDNFSRERFMTTYYVARKLENDTKYHEIEKYYSTKFYLKHKDALIIASIGAAVVGASVVGIGLWLNNKKNK
jgi:hypothetical protein